MPLPTVACFSIVLALSFSWLAPAQAEGPPVDFNRDIRPILSDRCFHCHGQDENTREAGLRLDRRDSATAEADSGEIAVVPMAGDASELVRRVSSDDESLRMPPEDSGEPLSAEQIALLRRWIDEGAKYAKHWSFTPPVRPPLPAVSDPSRPAGAIDYFVQARLEGATLNPAPPADRYTLIRRLSLDLRGLPPAPQEVDRFIRDTSPQAYEKLVDRFLKDTAYGERWARLWLDLARYADSKGYGSDPLRTIWRYRDWVIDAFNQNMPFDQFTIEQLAGDLLPDATFQQRVATAMHRNTMTNTEGGTDDEEFRVAAVKDRVDTTAQVWMGLTMGCAKCHSHKYDPITQREYYQFFAYFNQTADADRNDESPYIQVPTSRYRAQLKKFDEQLAQLKQRLAANQSAEEASAAKDAAALAAQIAKLEKSRPKPPTVPVMQELPADQRRTTRILIKGDFLNPGEVVEPGAPAAFHVLGDELPKNRLGMARWLVDRDNPLTARVLVNRFWAQLFGQGLVSTEEDFGTQGEPPSHPLLLDWLAVELMEGGWDVQALLKKIVVSRTYRQSSRTTAEHLKKDPGNRLLSRGPRFRLEAEMVRDQALALSGLLSRKMHGPSVYPPQPAGLWRAAFNGKDRNWATSSGDDRYRRGLYTFWRRSVPYPSMAAFDAPSREICNIRRIRTNTPLQALVTLNDPVFVEAAQALARRIEREGGDTVDSRTRFALRLCLVRPARSDQIQQIAALYRSQWKHYRNDAAAAQKMACLPMGPLPEGADGAELAAWTVVANVLLNLDGVLTKS